MGFNNSGAQVMAARLEQAKHESILSVPIGINLGKSKVTPLEAAAHDYLNSFRLLKELGDYFVVNVSSPNTPGLRSLQDASMLSAILDLLQQDNRTQKPIFVKIAPFQPQDAREGLVCTIDVVNRYALYYGDSRGIGNKGISTARGILDEDTHGVITNPYFTTFPTPVATPLTAATTATPMLFIAVTTAGADKYCCCAACN